MILGRQPTTTPNTYPLGFQHTVEENPRNYLKAVGLGFTAGALTIAPLMTFAAYKLVFEPRAEADKIEAVTAAERVVFEEGFEKGVISVTAGEVLSLSGIICEIFQAGIDESDEVSIDLSEEIICARS